MENNEIHDPIDMVSYACCSYKSSIFGLFHSDFGEEQLAVYRKAAKEYKQAIKAAMKYLREELKQLESEVNRYDSKGKSC